MKKIDLGQTINTIANIGVIAGIAFLVVELNQNQTMMRAQTRQQVSDGLVDHVMAVVIDPNLSEIVFSRGCDNITTVCESNDIDQARYDLYWSARFRYWEGVHYQYRVGLYDEAEFQKQRIGWQNILTQPAIAAVWRTGRPSYSEEFVAEVDALLSD